MYTDRFSEIPTNHEGESCARATADNNNKTQRRHALATPNRTTVASWTPWTSVRERVAPPRKKVVRAGGRVRSKARDGGRTLPASHADVAKVARTQRQATDAATAAGQAGEARMPMLAPRALATRPWRERSNDAALEERK